MKIPISILLISFLIVCNYGCKQHSRSVSNVHNGDTLTSTSTMHIDLAESLQEIPPTSDKDFMRSINTIIAHDEQDTIVGNITGMGIDTLYVLKTVGENGQSTKFFMASTNPKIPVIELYGYSAVPPKLVNEGDLDGNGTTEVGYLHTWMNSQWRYYRIFTLVNNQWRYIVEGDYLETPQWFRESGSEVAEPGNSKGTILIHHYHERYDEDKDELIYEIKDSIVSPTYSFINDLPS